MWECVLYFLKIAQAVTFQVTLFKEQYNLADFTELDFKRGGEYFDLLSKIYLRGHLAHLSFHTRKTKV